MNMEIHIGNTNANRIDTGKSKENQNSRSFGYIFQSRKIYFSHSHTRLRSFG